MFECKCGERTWSDKGRPGPRLRKQAQMSGRCSSKLRDRGIPRQAVRRALSADRKNKASSSGLVRLEGGHAHV